MLHGSGELLDLREVVVSLVETWRESVRRGDNTLLPEALPPLLLAVDAAGQRELLDTVRALINKVWISGFRFEGRAAGATGQQVLCAYVCVIGRRCNGRMLGRLRLVIMSESTAAWPPVGFFTV